MDPYVKLQARLVYDLVADVAYVSGLGGSPPERAPGRELEEILREIEEEIDRLPIDE